MLISNRLHMLNEVVDYCKKTESPENIVIVLTRNNWKGNVCQMVCQLRERAGAWGSLSGSLFLSTEGGTPN